MQKLFENQKKNTIHNNQIINNILLILKKMQKKTVFPGNVWLIRGTNL